MKQLLFCIFLLLLEGCSSNQPPAVSGQIDELPTIYPDYIDVTIPQSIAPLNFAVQTEGKACAVFTTEGYAFTVYASNGAFSISSADMYQRNFVLYISKLFHQILNTSQTKLTAVFFCFFQKLHCFYIIHTFILRSSFCTVHTFILYIAFPCCTYII